jgi:3-deoxy-7-phosphoheptulonate synthase
MVPDLAVASVAAGADGLIVEVHPDPGTAMSDGYQSLNFDGFTNMMKRVFKVAKALTDLDSTT